MNKLPIEIQDIIWNLYWKDIFQNKVIFYLNKIQNRCNLLNDVKLNKIFRFTDEKIKLKFLNKYNMILNELNADKGSFLFSKKIDFNLSKVFNSIDSIYYQYALFKPITNYISIKSGLIRIIN